MLKYISLSRAANEKLGTLPMGDVAGVRVVVTLAPLCQTTDKDKAWFLGILEYNCRAHPNPA